MVRRGGGNSSTGGVPSKAPASEAVTKEAVPTNDELVQNCFKNEGAEPPPQDTPTKDICYIDTSPFMPLVTSFASSQGR